ncbi:MAG: S8 family serine peptidase [Chitinophagales bacterium]
MKNLVILMLVLFGSLSLSNVYAQFTKPKTPVFNPKVKTINPKLDKSVLNNPNLELKEIQTKMEPEENVPNSFIVFFNPKAVPAFYDAYPEDKFESREELLKAYQGFEKKATNQIMEIAEGKMGLKSSQIKQVYTGIISGFAVEMSEGQAKEFSERARQSELVKSFGRDIYMNFDAVSPAPEMIVSSPMPAQNVNWGVEFVGSRDGFRLVNWAFVLDTGIDFDHPDLRVSRSWSRNYVSGEGSDDLHGHGTHVAGIIAAKDNNIGTKGVAAGAVVVAVKVLNRRGKGKWSEILSGVNYAGSVAWRGDVLNLSLGGSAPNWWQSFWGDTRNDVENALKRIGQRGRYVTIAAGNDAKNANDYSPARANGQNIYTISNMRSDRRLANSSNYGNGPVDYAAPGSSIYSTYKDGRYATMGGTSMAAPHVAGILLINRGRINTRGRLVWDRDSTKDPIAVIR